VLNSWKLPAVSVCAVALCCLPAGCNSKDRMYPVKGTVRFASGEPLTMGKVVVDNPDGKRSSWGAIKGDGTFQMGTMASTDGVPAGTYQVYFRETTTQPPVDESSAPGGTAGSGPAAPFVPQQLIHPKFLKENTSGISFEVPKQRVWDIVVEPPK